MKNNSSYITTHIVSQEDGRIIPVDFRTPSPGYCKINYICNRMIEPT